MRTTILVAFVILMLMPTCTATTHQELYDFLDIDKTDQREYVRGFYDCGFFARDFARNASDHNITIGGLILGNDPRFRGYDNTIVNYIIIEGDFIVIDPQTDRLYGLNHGLRHDGMSFEYYRTYTDGTNVPSFWHPLWYTGRLNQ